MMTTFLVFWSAILAIICFCVSSVLKGILALLMGASTATTHGFVGLVFGGGTAFLLYLIADTVQTITNGTFWSTIGLIVLGLVFLAVTLGISFGIGAAIVAFLNGLAERAEEVLGAIYAFFDNGYEYFLGVIVQKTKSD